MIKIFAPWSKELVNSPEALHILKESGIISGVELSYMPSDILLVQKAGLEISIHNPLREFFEVIEGGFLEDPNLRSVLTPEKLIASEECASLPISFHAGYSIFKYAYSKEEFLENFHSNLQLIRKSLSKVPIIETPFHVTSGLISHSNSVAIEYVTSLDFVSELLSSGAGFLFDISHVYLGAYYREKAFGKPRQEHLSELIDLAKDKILQIHFSVPSGNEQDGFFDSHGILDGSENPPIVVSLLDCVLKSAPNVGSLTLEMRFSGTAIEQAHSIVNQAKMLMNMVPILKQNLFNGS
jgi:hypothetical protein